MVSKEEVKKDYLAAGKRDNDAELLAAGYMDAIDGIFEGMYFMLKITGPLSMAYTTEAGHVVKGTIEAP